MISQVKIIPTKVGSSQVDSLKNALKHLDAKVDSLNKITNENRIGADFFSDVISQDLYMFSTIIIIAGLVSWGFIVKILSMHKKKVEIDNKKRIKDFEQKIEQEFFTLDEDVSYAIFDVRRAMYFSAANLKNEYSSFRYALSCVTALIKIDKEDVESLDTWLTATLEHLELLELGELSIRDEIDFIANELKLISENVSEDLNGTVEEIKKTVFHLAYSNIPPPENLLEGNANVPPSSENPVKKI